MIYKFRILSSENADFLRDIEINSEQTFLDFHNAIQQSVGYDNSQLASFFLTNEKWEKEREITLMEMEQDDDYSKIVMDVSPISEFIKDEKQKLLYVFDFFAERAFFIKLIEIKNASTNIKYPVCTNIVGNAPSQLLAK
ncbi:MAG: hypothetical protein KAT68_11815 [Bacteroidales bacterium]|nr:hypothetical protein [Bacteroidales bacterium]